MDPDKRHPMVDSQQRVRDLFYRPHQHQFGLSRTGLERKDVVSVAILLFLLFNPFVMTPVSGAPARSSSHVYLEGSHARPVLPGWSDQGPADSTGFQRIVFAVKQESTDALKAVLARVSDPFSSSYGKHLTFEQVNELVRPLPARLAAVRAWIRDSFAGHIEEGSLDETQASDFIVARIRRAQLEKVLGVAFRILLHAESGVPAIRSLAPYRVSSDVADHLDFIGGIHRVPDVSRIVKEKRYLKNVSADLLGATPASLRKLYNVSVSTGSAANNSQSVAAFLEQHYLETDYGEFNRLYNSENVGFPIAKVIGPNHAPAGVEASLDVEYITSVAASRIPTWFWSVGGREGTQEPFLEWTLEISNTSNAPWVHSVSYGDDEDSLDASYMIRVSTEFVKLGARGISLLFASGDSGVGGSSVDCKTFVPNFPVSSPYVTAVGGTTLPLTGNGEETASLSGGGFSNVFARPDFQNAAVSNYLNTFKNLPPASYYNATGRAYPDIAALAEGFLVVANLIPYPGVAGTSCAAPTASSIITNLNDIRLRAGKSPLGFLNPLIYSVLSSTSGALYDVVKGCNPGCGLDGFCATNGWDGSSGWGTLNYAVLKDLVLSLP